MDPLPKRLPSLRILLPPCNRWSSLTQRARCGDEPLRDSELKLTAVTPNGHKALSGVISWGINPNHQHPILTGVKKWTATKW